MMRPHYTRHVPPSRPPGVTFALYSELARDGYRYQSGTMRKGQTWYAVPIGEQGIAFRASRDWATFRRHQNRM